MCITIKYKCHSIISYFMCLFILVVKVGQLVRKFKLVEWRSSIYSKGKAANVNGSG